LDVDFRLSARRNRHRDGELTTSPRGFPLRLLQRLALLTPIAARGHDRVNAADFSSRAARRITPYVIGGRITRAQAGDLSVPVLDASETSRKSRFL
jgi:hypothetical protein